jgi:IS30 family transposase
MGTPYRQLCLTERIEIYRLHSAGKSLRMIASFLGRSASTISRELKRNSKPTKAWPGGYLPDRANRLAERRRRWDCRHKLARQPALRAVVHDRLAMGWSPEQIAGRLTRDNAPMRISHESIYRFIYHRSAQKDYWHRLLPKRKSRRGTLGRRGGSSVQRIKHRQSLHHRPLEALDRATPGHWEADLMLFAKYGQAVLVSHERHSRILLADRRPNKAAQGVADKLTAMLAPLPSRLRRTITFDNGTEFAFHHQLTERMGIKTFFCDPYAPWQKGGVENAISRMRRRLPRKSDLAQISQPDLDRMIADYNNTPRKCLGFRTPAEVFLAFLKPLHFKRDSTFPRSRE